MKFLGKLEEVDLREIWPDEANDFTPWLKENISTLSEAVGMDIDISESEGSVGAFSVDLVGTNLSSGRTVVIENQLASTDHSHLGQLLTYAAGRKADIAIWITRGFRDEHRSALEWLNDMSDGQRSFFGIQVRAYRIGESLPAPYFDVVVQPNEWAQAPHATPISAKGLAYQQFFTELLDDIKSAHPNLTSAKKVYPNNWTSFPIGRTGFSNAFNFTRDGRFRAAIYIHWRYRRAFFLLRDQRDQIEKELGEELDWQELPKDTRIAAYAEGSIEGSPEELIELRKWAVERIELFNKVFRPKIATLPRELSLEMESPTSS